MFKHILVPTDGSALSLKAVEGAVELAKTLGARITAYVCTETYPYMPVSEFVVETPLAFKERIDAQAELALSDVKRACEKAGVACDGECSEHDVPYQGIIEAAQRHGCDLILMASHGRRGLSGVLLGSETQKVLTHTTIPVLVFR